MYYMVISFLCVGVVFSRVVLPSHGLTNMSDKYGARIRRFRVNLVVFVYAWNYGAVIVTISNY